MVSTVWYASIFAEKCGMSFCKGTGTVRWYGLLQKLNYAGTVWLKVQGT